ncbi:MAG TPA: 23S rRNA (adenine(2503)-C(2))-methyltransferase RlmN [Clostridiaceae bacterium]|nr:23S rRNA (adenine(2503)-C(2))-methyltransferase RlmN [Clostridiaceae bacterium]
MESDKLNLKNMSVDEIGNLCVKLGERKFRGEQIFRWIYKGIEKIDEMSDLPEAFRKKLNENTCVSNLTIVRKYVSKIDGTSKYLLETEDGNIIESVLMEYGYGLSACISTQVGCAMGCSFCASTIGGFVRNLSTGEMADEILKMGKDCGRRISHIVLMGSGEPLNNFENVIKFLSIVNCQKGLNIGMRHITISTCGLVPEIIRLASLNLQITLAVSLHAPNDEIRKRIMPVAYKYNINDVINACREYADKTKRRVTFEYSLIDGVNDGPGEAYELSMLLKGMLCHVNLIPINEIKERNYRKSDARHIDEFKRVLEKNSISVTVRRELGADINAACGQLRRDYISKNMS